MNLQCAGIVKSLLLAVCLLAGGACAEVPSAPDRTVEVGAARLKVDVYAPSGQARGVGRPAVLMVHGGGWAAGDRNELRELALLARDQGVVALSMDYRLTSQSGVHWPMPAQDVADVLDWMRANSVELGIDPGRIALLGGSAGGHLAAWVARGANPAKRPVRLIVLWGPWDLTRLPDAGPEWVRPSVERLLDGRPARSASPLYHLVVGMPPTLIVHGVDDPIVPIDQSRRACAALSALGNDCTLIELPKQGHAPEDPKQIRRALSAVRAALSAL